MALKPFALILCLHIAVHHVANSKVICHETEMVACHARRGGVTVTDSMGKMSVDPGETGTALQAGGVRGSGPPLGENCGQLASVSGKGRM